MRSQLKRKRRTLKESKKEKPEIQVLAESVNMFLENDSEESSWSEEKTIENASKVFKADNLYPLAKFVFNNYVDISGWDDGDKWDENPWPDNVEAIIDHFEIDEYEFNEAWISTLEDNDDS